MIEALLTGDGTKTLKAAILFAAVLMVAGCSTYRFPGVHRITIQQGNVISQTMIDKLKPGMSKSQVRFVLGNPILDDALNQDRWDYFYSIQVAGGDTITRKLQIYFIDGKLSHFEGDFVPSDVKERQNDQQAATQGKDTESLAARP